MKLKKLAALAMACITAVTAASLAGCNQNQGDTGTDESWNKVSEAGKLVLGLDDAFPPMGFRDPESGEIVGFDIDVATEVCNRLGLELVLQPVDWNTKTAELDNGNVDCLWNGMSKTDELDEQLNLSEPYMKNNQVILVNKDSDYKTKEDLAGKSLGVQAGSSAEVALNKDTEFKDSLGEVVALEDYALAILEIQNGTVDAVAIDEVVARYYLSTQPDAFRILGEAEGEVISMASEEYVIGFRKNDEALKTKIEDTLKEMAEDGKLAEISQKWFAEDVTVIGE